MARARAMRRCALASAALGAVTLVPSEANADPPWTSRRMTLADGEFGATLGFGFADDSQAQVTGSGMYLQLGYGITQRFEVLVRDGVRFGTYGEYARAEQYGRLYTTDGTVTPGPGAFANPDAVLLARIVDLDWFELGGELEVGFPVESGTSLDTTVGVPLTFHAAPWFRFDTGAFVTLTYTTPVHATVVAPFEAWFQTGNFPLWFGPLTAVSVNHAGTLNVPFGFGAGYAVNPDIDIRAEWLVPQVNAAPEFHDTGVGLGVEFRH